MTNNQLNQNSGVDFISSSARNLSGEILVIEGGYIDKSHRQAVSKTIGLLSRDYIEGKRGDQEC